MAWKTGILRCEGWVVDDDGARRMCGNTVGADTHGIALRAANLAGWWRGNRGGRRADLCGDHRPRSRRDR